MEIIYSPHFAREYKKLPHKIKLIAEKKERLFRLNPFHAGLRTHKLKGQLSNYWAFSIDFKYRIIFEFKGKNQVNFLSAGDHKVYE